MEIKRECELEKLKKKCWWRGESFNKVRRKRFRKGRERNESLQRQYGGQPRENLSMKRI